MSARWHTPTWATGVLLRASAASPAELLFARLRRNDGGDDDNAVTTTTATAAANEATHFCHIVDAAAGRRHAALVTDAGQLLLLDAGAARSRVVDVFAAGDGGACAAAMARRVRVACGARHTIAYCRGTRAVVAFGANDAGQLGVGDGRRDDDGGGGVRWDAAASWWSSAAPHDRGDDRDGVDEVACGARHTVARTASGRLLACGANTLGELGVGSADAHATPQPVIWTADDGDGDGGRCVKIAAGNGFTLFLQRDGGVRGCGGDAHGALPFRRGVPTLVPLLRDFVAASSPSTSAATPARQPRGRRIRVKDVACLAHAALYVSARDEVLVQGGLPDDGVHVPAPRLAVVRQDGAVDALCARMGRAVARERRAGGFAIDGVVAGASTALVCYRNGCVAGFGANGDGQLRARARGVAVVAAEELLPVFAPCDAAAQTRGPPTAMTTASCPHASSASPPQQQQQSPFDTRMRVAVGDGFAILVDTHASRRAWPDPSLRVVVP